MPHTDTIDPKSRHWLMPLMLCSVAMSAMCLSSCSSLSAKDYGWYGAAYDSMSNGYRDEKIQDGLHRIWMREGGLKTLGLTSAYAYHRASSVCLANGYRYFVAVSSYQIRSKTGPLSDQEIIQRANANTDFRHKARWVENLGRKDALGYTGSKLKIVPVMILAGTGIGIPIAMKMVDHDLAKAGKETNQVMLLIQCYHTPPPEAKAFDASKIYGQIQHKTMGTPH